MADAADTAGSSSGWLDSAGAGSGSSWLDVAGTTGSRTGLADAAADAAPSRPGWLDAAGATPSRSWEAWAMGSGLFRLRGGVDSPKCWGLFTGDPGEYPGL